MRGQAETLRFTARQRIAAAIQRQIAQAHLLHALQACRDFRQQRLGNGALARVERELRHTVHRGSHRQGHQVPQRLASQAHGARLGIQAGAMAGRTRDLSHKLGEVALHAVTGITLQQAPAVRQDALESAGASAEAVPKSLALALPYVNKGCIDINA